MRKRKVIVTSKFDSQFDETYNYLGNESKDVARKFARNLDEQLDIISSNPTANPPEPNLPTKRNWYRFALYLKSWKIVFKITNNLLVFLGLVHTSQHPREIKKLRSNKYD